MLVPKAKIDCKIPGQCAVRVVVARACPATRRSVKIISILRHPVKGRNAWDWKKKGRE